MEKEYKEPGCYTKNGLRQSCEDCIADTNRASLLAYQVLRNEKLPGDKLKDSSTIKMVANMAIRMGMKTGTGTITKEQFNAAEKGDFSSLSKYQRNVYKYSDIDMDSIENGNIIQCKGRKDNAWRIDPSDWEINDEQWL